MQGGGGQGENPRSIIPSWIFIAQKQTQLHCYQGACKTTHKVNDKYGAQIEREKEKVAQFLKDLTLMDGR